MVGSKLRAFGLPVLLSAVWGVPGLVVLAGGGLVNAPVAQGAVLLGLGAWWAGRGFTGRLRGPVPWVAAAAGALALLALLGTVIAPDWRVSLPKLVGLWL